MKINLSPRNCLKTAALIGMSQRQEQNHTRNNAPSHMIGSRSISRGRHSSQAGHSAGHGGGHHR